LHAPAFTAMNRENKLYREEIKKLAKRTIVRVMKWEIPLVSAYVFFGWMLCVYYASAALIPPFITGVVILFLLRNYAHSMSEQSHFGFPPVSLSEMLFTLLTGRKIAPLTRRVEKTHKKYKQPHHMQFPFSDDRIAERLSMEDIAIEGNIEGQMGKNLKVDYGSDDGSDDDDDAYFHSDDEDHYDESSGAIGSRRTSLSDSISMRASVKMMQDTSISGKGSPFISKMTKELDEMEEKYDKATFGIFNEEIYEGQHSGKVDGGKGLKLGKYSKNPIILMKTQLMVPITRILHKMNCLVRLTLNVFMWKDHYLSFWVLCFLFGLMVLLLIFPWRIFFFVMGVLLFGPQNIIIGFFGDYFRRIRVNQVGAHIPDDFDCAASTDSSDSDDLPRFSKSSSKSLKLENKNLIIPYGLVKRERFYDWPPDEQVSKVLESRTTLVKAYPRKSGVNSILLNQYRYK